MTFQSGLRAFALLSAASLSMASVAQTAPAIESTQASINAKGGNDAAARDQPSPSVPAPRRSVSMQAGDSRGAATGASQPVTARQAGMVRGRDEVRAEAVAAVRQHRATLAMDLDLMDGK